MASENIDAQNPNFAGLLGRGYVNAFAAVQVPNRRLSVLSAGLGQTVTAMAILLQAITWR